MHDYEVVMGFHGSVYAGTNRKKARRAYRAAVNACLSRGATVSVTLFRDGRCVKEFDGEMVGRVVREWS
jgi:hypothetical protein